MPRSVLTEQEFTTIRMMRSKEVGILSDVESIKIGGARVVSGACCDGYRIHDQIERLVHYLNGHPESHAGVCPHKVTFNGGALNASPDFFPSDPLPTGAVFLAQIRKGMEVQKTSIVLLHVHAPCAMARERNLSLEEMFRHLFIAKIRLKKELADLAPTVIPLCHIDYHDYGEGPQRTYRVSREAWERYQTHNQKILSTRLPEKRPADVKFSADVAKRLNNAERRFGHNREIEAAIHTLESCYLCRMIGAVLNAPERFVGTAKTLRLLEIVTQ